MLVFLGTFQPFIVPASEVGLARLWCISLRFQQGSDTFGDTLDLSTINGTPNGELAPYSGLTSISGFSLDASGFPVFGTLYLDLPSRTDVNGNGFNDFFESEFAVSATTTGNYTAGEESGTITATWQRAAGSSTGTCNLHLVDNIFGDLGTFRHVFELLEYKGPLFFTPGSPLVSGNFKLFKTGDLNSVIEGPFRMLKDSADPFNQLTLQPGDWTNSAAQVLNFSSDPYSRESPWTTNYFGFVDFTDGEPSTPDQDYLVWLLSIDDLNDSNNNGIPDFSDNPQTGTLPKPPQLSLISASGVLALSLSGDVGHVHDVQRTDSLAGTNWQTVISVTLTNDPQPVSLDPSGPASFWRVVAH
jgi:hypothetical protein